MRCNNTRRISNHLLSIPRRLGGKWRRLATDRMTFIDHESMPMAPFDHNDEILDKAYRSRERSYRKLCEELGVDAAFFSVEKDENPTQEEPIYNSITEKKLTEVLVSLSEIIGDRHTSSVIDAICKSGKDRLDFLSTHSSVEHFQKLNQAQNVSELKKGCFMKYGWSTKVSVLLCINVTSEMSYNHKSVSRRYLTFPSNHQ